MAAQIKFATSGWRAVMAAFCQCSTGRVRHRTLRAVAAIERGKGQSDGGPRPVFSGESFCRDALLGKQPASLFAQVGSFYTLCENFRLTPEVKQKFTEKLRCDPSKFDGTKVACETCPGQRIVVLLTALRHGASGARA